MKIFILVDEKSIVRCMASEKSNLHKDKLHMKKYHVEDKGTVGDEYDVKTDEWIARPENYPQPTEKDLNEAKIGRKMRKLAIDSLKSEGELPEDYEE